MTPLAKVLIYIIKFKNVRWKRMNKLIVVTILTIVSLFTICPAGMTAKAAAKPKPKPAAKAPVKSTTIPHVEMGTSQLSGEYGDFNKVYTLGREDPCNITLKSAEYSVEPILIGDRLFTVNNQEKFLILHMIFHNPQPKERLIRWDSFLFTAVDANDQNYDYLIDLGAEGDRTSVSMNMKPTQKKDVFGAIIVPAAGEVPKLMIKSIDNLVIRYDLRGKVKALPALNADPADKTGATALPKVKAVPNTFYSIGIFSLKLNKVEYSKAAKIGENELSEGNQFCIVNCTMKNMDVAKAYFRWDTFNRILIDTDGVETGNCVDLFQASKDRTFETDLEPAKEYTLRYLFTLPADSTIKTFSVTTTDAGRPLEFDISNMK